MSTEANFTTWMAAQADDLRRERDALRARLAETQEQVRRVLELADAAEDAQRRLGRKWGSLVAKAIRGAVDGEVNRFSNDDRGGEG